VTFDLILVGFGNVARRFVTLLHEQRATLARDYDITTRVVGIVTRRHGQQFSTRGIDLNIGADTRVGPYAPGMDRKTKPNARADRTPNQDVGADPRVRPESVAFVREAVKRSAAAARARRLVLVETTTLDIQRGQPAIDHVRTALAGGAHVITANKGPAAFAYRELARAAERAERRFLFEGAVMDGIPIFNLVRETLPAVNIVGFRGVVNSTTNFILTAMEQGQPFDHALAEMQGVGIAEADPSLDIDGWDAAAKTAALANVLLGARLTPRTVERQGITRDMGRRAMDAREAGRRLKLVARAGPEGSRIAARVAPEELPDDDLLATLDAQQNAIIFHTDLLGELAIVQRGGNLTQTAYALLSDLVAIANPRASALRRSRATGRSRSSAPARRIP
jgi:homoserine dehydrogenase